MSSSQGAEDALNSPGSRTEVRDILKGFDILKTDRLDELTLDSSAADAFLFLGYICQSI